jgi:hypothetical protein
MDPSRPFKSRIVFCLRLSRQTRVGVIPSRWSSSSSFRHPGSPVASEFSLVPAQSQDLFCSEVHLVHSIRVPIPLFRNVPRPSYPPTLKDNLCFCIGTT